MMVSVMPMGATFASATDGEETSSEVTLTEESVEPTESTEPEESEPDGEPEESGEPENTTYANSISGVLWLDMFDDIENSIYAGDGTRQAEESPLAGYRVELYKADDTDNAIASTTTGADGKYSFENIEPGSYVVGVKTTTMDGVEYLLPLFWLDGTEGDNRFVATYDEAADAYLYAYTAPITVAEDSEITGRDAGMRTVPGIQPTANTTYTIDMTNSTTVAASISAQSIPGVTLTGNIYYMLNFLTTVDPTDTYILTGSTTTVRVIVATGVTANITLKDANITCAVASPFQLEGSAKVNLTLEGDNILKGTYSSNATNGYAGLYVSSSATLTIGGTGSLQAAGSVGGTGAGGAGIGGGNGASSGWNNGKVIINSGTIIATGGNFSAGIGGSATNLADNRGGSGGTIEINGGTIVATSVAGSGAGIGGGGQSGHGGTITITGGTVTATGSYRSAGIGGGGNGNMGGGSAGNITITGGRVTATGGSNIGTGTPIPPGIGGGCGATSAPALNTSGTIIFTGGSIYPSTNAGVVGDNAVLPSPTNGSTNGAPDTVHMVQFSGYSDNDPFYIVAGGTKQSYDYYANAHPNGIVYPWLIYPGVLTKDATNITTTTADLNGEVYLVGNGYSVTSGYFQVTTTSGDYTSPVKTESIHQHLPLLPARLIHIQ